MKRVVESLLIILALIFSLNILPGPAKAFVTLASSSSSLLERPQSAPRTVVAVNLEAAEFTVRELKYRVFFNKAEMKRIPMNDYDFKAAFTDELLNALSTDGRMTWRQTTKNENVDVPLVIKKKVPPPALDAERILLVNIIEYGAFLATLAKDKFYIVAKMKLIDRATGKKLWDYNVYERIDLDGKVSEMQADNQKGLKEGINKVLEKVCRKVAEDLARERI